MCTCRPRDGQRGYGRSITCSPAACPAPPYAGWHLLRRRGAGGGGGGKAARERGQDDCEPQACLGHIVFRAGAPVQLQRQRLRRSPSDAAASCALPRRALPPGRCDAGAAERPRLPTPDSAPTAAILPSLPPPSSLHSGGHHPIVRRALPVLRPVPGPAGGGGGADLRGVRHLQLLEQGAAPSAPPRGRRPRACAAPLTALHWWALPPIKAEPGRSAGFTAGGRQLAGSLPILYPRTHSPA